ncbi:MAG: hypothetical protein KatS3mg077_1828 [Candidatus Binatia bacterium]|nr:MAG: hypothetical protein KatS3mg077_1828 [Candidatus Binatia bacterium]
MEPKKLTSDVKRWSQTAETADRWRWKRTSLLGFLCAMLAASEVQALSWVCSGSLGERRAAIPWNGNFEVDAGAGVWEGKARLGSAEEGTFMEIDVSGSLRGSELHGTGQVVGTGSVVTVEGWVSVTGVFGTLTIADDVPQQFHGTCRPDVDSVKGADGPYSGNPSTPEPTPTGEPTPTPDPDLPFPDSPYAETALWCKLQHRGVLAGALALDDAYCERVIALAKAWPGSPSEALSSIYCPGDCDGDGRVTVDEVVLGARALLGEVKIEPSCRLDRDGSGEVTVDEIIAAVDLALFGCPESP